MKKIFSFIHDLHTFLWEDMFIPPSFSAGTLDKMSVRPSEQWVFTMVKHIDWWRKTLVSRLVMNS